MIQGSLLIVDDDRQVLESMADWLRSQGLQVDAVRGVAEANDRLSREAYDLLLVDIRLQDGDGLDLLEQVRRTKTRHSIADRKEKTPCTPVGSAKRCHPRP